MSIGILLIALMLTLVAVECGMSWQRILLGTGAFLAFVLHEPTLEQVRAVAEVLLRFSVPVIIFVTLLYLIDHLVNDHKRSRRV